MTRYTGKLAKPMQDINELFEEAGCFSGLGFNEEEKLIKKEQIARKHAEETVEKLKLLLDFYNITGALTEQLVWFDLSMCLAEAHVPGFKQKRKAGVKTKWDEYHKALLKLDVEDYQNEEKKAGKNVSVTHALKVLAKKNYWKPFVKNTTKPVEALRRQYYKADDRLVNHMREPIKHHTFPLD